MNHLRAVPGADGSVELNAIEKNWASSLGYTDEEWSKIKEAGK